MNQFSMYEGLWLKGSLHCHSNLSDGLLHPDDVAKFYEERGYALLSITDHEKLSGVKSFKGIYSFGVEVSRGRGKLSEPYHIVILGVNDPAILNLSDLQSLIDYVNESGGLAFIAHPYWSNLVYEDLTQLSGYIGIEIYNTGCDVEVAKGYSLTYWDNLLSSGRKVLGLAVDDSHRYFVPPIDADGGYIWVNVDDVCLEETLESIRAGRFYASMGPKIIYLHHAQNFLRILSTPIVRLNLVAPNGKGFSISIATILKILSCWNDPNKRRICEDIIEGIDNIDEGSRRTIHIETTKYGSFMVEYDHEGIIRFEVKRDFNYPYFRVEIVDGKNRYAWTNPISNP
ncbi:MAG: hypothetical protein QXW55_00910 [Candidatus Bathyarchaeia archaeon]